ncbi:MAG: phosphoglycerate kinase [Patescibacteria group bacterium]
MRSLGDAVLSGKRVILRLGLDLPLDDNGKILDDERLRIVLPTIHFLLNRNAKVIIIGHLGRPKGQTDPKLSLRPVYIQLSALLKKPVHFAPKLFSGDTKVAVEKLPEGAILGLENLRFDSGEDNNSRTFARKLANYGDIYVNDAFSVAHREAASTVAITEFLPSYPGLAIDKEINVLAGLLKNPAHPFVAIIGGVKIADKLPAITHIGRVADRVLVGGGVANTFMASQGMNIRESIYDKDYLDQATAIIKRSQQKIVLPVDFVWGDGKILDNGPETTEMFAKYLKGAQTIFWNGSLGHTEDPRYRKCSDTIAGLIAESPATTIIAGGNTIEIFSRLDLLDKVTFVSSGGGAALELLSGKVLPGIRALHS